MIIKPNWDVIQHIVQLSTQLLQEKHGNKARYFQRISLWDDDDFLIETTHTDHEQVIHSYYYKHHLSEDDYYAEETLIHSSPDIYYIPCGYSDKNYTYDSGTGQWKQSTQTQVLLES